VPDRYTVTGDDRLASTLTSAGHKVGDLSKANKRAADLVASEARATAPRLTGALAASTVGFSDRTTASVGSDLVYAPPIHYGWPGRNIEPNPYIEQAFESTASQWQAAYEDEVGRAIRTVKGA
jgi:hypothetical protein